MGVPCLTLCATVCASGARASTTNEPDMTTATLESQIKAAESVVNAIDYSADGWEAKWDKAMVAVRQLRDQISAAKPVEEFCSIDSGIHRTRLLNGRVI